MINWSGYILCFIGGYCLHKYSDKIFNFIKQLIFFLKNYKTILGSKQYNDFYEDYFSQKDFIKEVDKNDE